MVIKVKSKKSLRFSKRKAKTNYKTSKKFVPLVRNYQPELKHLDRYSTTNVTQSGALLLLTDITTQGADDNQRIGDSVHAVSIDLKYCIVRNTSSNYDNVRIMIIRDNQGTNAPSINQILEPGFISSGFSPFAPRNHYYYSRFQIISDKTYSMSLNMGVTKNHRLYLKINRKLEYVGAATFTGQLYMLIIGDNSNVLQLPYVNWITRMVYYD